MGRKKALKYLLYVLIVLVLSCSVAYADDAPLSISTGSFPRGLAGVEYSATLQATGGVAPYTFFISRGRIQDGLTLSEDGVISGMPTASGAYSVYFGVRDSAGNTATKRLYVRISGKTVDFTVTNDRWEYDGQPHTATVTPSLPEVEESDYEVFYGGETSQTNAGSYYIRVLMHKPGYLAGNAYPQLLTIERSTACELSLESAEFEYDGQVHALMPAITPGELASNVTVTYEGIGDTVYTRTTQAPSNSGRYRVTATQTNPNYAALVRTATLTINAPRVDFDVSNTEFDYDGQSHQATVTPRASEEEVPAYTVSYDDLSTADVVETLEAVTDAGIYQINIAFPDGNHAAGEMTATVVTVRPQTVDFTVTDTSFVYDSQPHRVTVAPATTGVSISLSDYAVFYDATATTEEERLAEITEAGSYRISVESLNRNYTVGALSADMARITRAVAFTATGTAYVYDGEAHRATVQPALGTADVPAFTVTYDNLATGETETLDAATEIGLYAIHVAFADPDYTAIDPEERLAVMHAPVNFRVLDTDFYYDGTMHMARVVRVTSGGGSGGSEDDESEEVAARETLPEITVTYDNLATEENDALDGMVEKGQYRVNVAFADPLYTVGTVQNDVVTVHPRKLQFTLAEDFCVYDGEPHTATVQPVLSEGEPIPVFTVRYDNLATEEKEELEAVTEAGVYRLQIAVTGEDYASETDSILDFAVQPKPVNFTVEHTEYIYDGAAHAAEVTPLWAEGETPQTYTVSYDDVATEDVETASDVTDAGSYRIQIALADPNYAALVTSGSAILTIDSREVVVTVSGELVKMDEQAPPYAAVTTPDDPDFSSYRVSYRAEDGTVYPESVGKAGVYTIQIESATKNYSVTAAGPTTFTVEEGVKVHFTITDNSAFWQEGTESYSATVTPSVEGFTGYEVRYYAQGGSEGGSEGGDILSAVTTPGTYRIEIVVTAEGRELGQVVGDSTFTLVSLISSFHMSKGNSLAVRIAAEDGQSALDAFRESHLYDGVLYSPEAWEGENLDLDETACFITPEVYRGGNLGELLANLGFTATRSDGTDGTADVTITVDGADVDSWQPTETGVYDLVYSYASETADQPVTVVRKIVLLTAEAGDTNGDRNVNAGDANYLRKRILENEDIMNAPGADERLFLYRVCDADHDGAVTDADAEAILNRMRVPVVRFYQ